MSVRQPAPTANSMVTVLNTIYLRLDTANDPLTGELVITPSTGTSALIANKSVTIKAGQRLYLDGA